MLDKNAKIAVVGAGAVGGLTAGYLALGGWDVELVAKHQAIVDIAAGPGLRLFGVKGESRAKLPAVAKVEELSGPKDVVFLATKATDMLEAARNLLPFMPEDSVLVSLQNGLCEQALGREVGTDRVIGCVVGFGATMHGPGELEMTSTGEFVIGNLEGKLDQRLPFLRDMMNLVAPTRMSMNIMGELYSKLIINSCITALGGVCGLYLGQMLAQKRVRLIFLQIMREAMTVAAAMDLRVEPAAAGKLDYYDYLDGKGILADFKRHLVIRLIGHKYRRLKSSLLQSLERGKPTEIDFLNGYICRQGHPKGVPTPVNDAVVRLIKEIESGKRTISPSNFDQITL